jgi:hypothetical protein
MKNPHLTADTDLVVNAEADVANATALLAVDFTGAVVTKAGMVVVAKDAAIANKFYVIGLDNNAKQLGEVYIATK